MRSGFSVPRGPFKLWPTQPAVLAPAAAPAPYRAVSLRQLTAYCPGYAGPCLQVKRSSDSTTQDIGFVSGFLDTASLLSFVGAGNGVVTIGYDQSGNARNWIGDPGHEPIIVSSGTLQTTNGKAAIRSTNPQRFTSAFGTCVQPCSTLAVWSVDSITNANFGFALIDGNPDGSAYWYGLDNGTKTADGQQGISGFSIADIGSGTSLMANGVAVAGGFQHTGSAWSLYFNGALDNTGPDTQVWSNTGGAQIFSTSGFVTWAAGTCQELIEWPVSLGDTTAKAYSLEQYNYWVATGATTFNQAVNITCTTSLSLLKQVGKALPISSVTATTASRRVGKALSISSTTATSAIKSVGKVLAISSVTATTVTALKVRLVNIAITCTTAVSKSISVGKQIAISSTTALSLLKQVGKIISIAATTSTTVSAIKVKIIVLTIACTTSVSKAVSVGKSLSIASTTAVSAIKSVGKKLTISSATALSAVKAVGKLLTISSTTAVTASAIKARLLVLTINCTTTLSRGAFSVSKLIGIASPTALSLTKGVAKRIAISSTTAVTATAFRFVHLLISIAATTSTTGRRAVGKVVNISSTSTLSMTRAISKSLIIACSSAVTRIVQSSVTAIAAYARHIIGKATMAFITGQAEAPVTIAPPTPLVITGSPMTTVHDPQDFICGDNWQFTGPLQDASGAPLSLTGATIQWKLDTVDGLANILTLDNAGNGGVSVVSAPTATILVNVTAVQSAAVTPGTYRDYLRVTLSNGTKLTEWTGIIRADHNPA